MRVTEEHLIAMDECEERLDAIIDDLERPTVFTFERLVEWLKTNPKALKSVIVSFRQELEQAYTEQQKAKMRKGA